MEVSRTEMYMSRNKNDLVSSALQGAICPLPQGLPVWGFAIPLPAVLLITLALYVLVLGLGLWIRLCLKVGCLLVACLVPVGTGSQM